MNEDKKQTWLHVGVNILILILAFTFGYSLNRRRDSTKIADAQATVESLTATVTELNRTVKKANNEIKQLKHLRDGDRTRIGELESLNIGLTESHQRTSELIGQQRDLIKELAAGDKLAGESSEGITEGLGQAIRTVDKLIKDIQEGED